MDGGPSKGGYRKGGGKRCGVLLGVHLGGFALGYRGEARFVFWATKKGGEI